MNTQMIVRIDPELKARISTLARSEGKTVSEIVREQLAAYVRDRDIESYIDDLWGRIGEKLREHETGPEDIQRFIDEARAGKS